MRPNPDPLLDLKSLAAAYGLPVATWRRAVHRGLVPSHKFGAAGAKVWVRRSAAEAFIEANKVEQQQRQGIAKGAVGQ